MITVAVDFEALQVAGLLDLQEVVLRTLAIAQAPLEQIPRPPRRRREVAAQLLDTHVARRGTATPSPIASTNSFGKSFLFNLEVNSTPFMLSSS